jgi:hypothetical protein
MPFNGKLKVTASIATIVRKEGAETQIMPTIQ